MTCRCPCCGGPAPKRLAVDVIAANLPPVRGGVLRALVKDFGAFVPVEMLMHRVYGLDPTGGPTDPNVLRVHISRLRRDLMGTGFAIESQQWLGYRIGAV